jgi:hypothetical protein
MEGYHIDEVSREKIQRGTDFERDLRGLPAKCKTWTSFQLRL